MAIQWTPAQRRKVGRALREHPLLSGRCDRAARRILPVARERDDTACALTLRCIPGSGRYVEPKVSLQGAAWFYHVAVNTERHFVDAFTGVGGTPQECYLQDYWKHPEALMWSDEEME